MGTGPNTMDIETLSRAIREMKIGTPVAGIQEGKKYTFGGIREYSGRTSRYEHMKGQPVVLLISQDRKRTEIALFIAPLLMFVNATDEELRFGRLPVDYYKKYCIEKSPEIPNRHEYQCHYKALALHVRRLRRPPP